MTEEYKIKLEKNFGKCRRTSCPFYSLDTVIGKDGKEIENGKKFHICHKNEEVWGHYYIMTESETNKEDCCICQKKEDYVNWNNLPSDVRWNEKEKHYSINWDGHWYMAWIDENGHLYTESAGT